MVRSQPTLHYQYNNREPPLIHGTALVSGNKVLVLFQKMEPLSFRELLLKEAGNTFTREFRLVVLFEKLEPLISGGYWNHKLPERQINGSSYMTDDD